MFSEMNTNPLLHEEIAKHEFLHFLTLNAISYKEIF